LEIYITTKNVYGSDLFYVKDKLAAKVVKGLTGRKTVTRLDIDNLSLLGLKIRVSEEAQDALGWTAEEAGAKAVNEADMEAWKLGREVEDLKESRENLEGLVQLTTEVDMDSFGDKIRS
tara:strand:- start:487 stop:843 length:357 start_codon:yes stop_codon:yes gene_type:complete